MQNKVFGTDGIRGIANTQISANLAFFVGKTLAIYLLEKKQHPLKIIVGRDTRTSGDMLCCAFCAGFMSMGGDVLNVGILPTPALSFLVTKTEADAGVMLTASHNPAEYNGIKIFDEKGLKIDEQVEIKLEKILGDIQNFLPDQKVGRLQIDEDLCKLWADYLMQKMGNLNLRDYKIMIDCANGASFRAIPYVLKTLGAIVDCKNVDSKGDNINKSCGSTHIENFASLVGKSNCDIAFAYDGDADRVIIVTNKGQVLTGDEILYIFAKYLHSKNELKNDTLITTVMTNYGVEKSLNKLGINTLRVKVGDKYVLQKMLEQDCNLGGEESGHIILGDYNLSADGLLATLFLLKIMTEREGTVEELLKGLNKYNTARIDLKVSDRQKILVQNGGMEELVQRFADELAENGRIVLRASGTESVVRILVEGEDLQLISSIAENLEQAVKEL